MSFLAIDSQKALFTMQKNQLQFEKSIIASRTLVITREMAELSESAGDDYDYENDPVYKQLEQTEIYYQTRSDNLDSQITLLDNALSSLKTLVNNNIKSTCQLNLTGGS